MSVREWKMCSRCVLMISTGMLVLGLVLSSLFEAVEQTHAIFTTTSILSFSGRKPAVQHQLPQSSMFTVPMQERRIAESNANAKQKTPIKVYIYDTLPAKYREDLVDCMMELAEVRNDDAFNTLSTKMADIAILKLFETYAHRTDDPSSADVFVVPYPHAAHCYCAEGWQRACGQVSNAEIEEIFSYLIHRNETNADRHLFLLSGHQYFNNGRLMQQPFKLLGGNLSPNEVDRRDHGTIVIPYLNDKALFQQVFHVPDDWWTRQRKYAFSFVFGELNPRNSGPDPRRVRLLFRDNWVKRNQTELGGLPVFVRSFTAGAAPKETMWKGFEVYLDSVFCPILAGDSCQQARFFHAMMAGCIPVVLKFSETDVTKTLPDSWATNLSSWYRQHGETTAAVYPFNNVLVDFGIDYDKCVVAVEAKSNLDVMKLPGVMDRMLKEDKERIRTIQSNLKDCAVRTAFGMGDNAHKYNDAFAQILRMIEHHLQQLSTTPNAVSV